MTVRELEALIQVFVKENKVAAEAYAYLIGCDAMLIYLTSQRDAVEKVMVQLREERQRYLEQLAATIDQQNPAK